MPRRTYINRFLLRCNVKPSDAALFSHSLLALLLSLHFEAGWNGDPKCLPWLLLWVKVANGVC